MSHGQVKNVNYKSVQLIGFSQSNARSAVWINAWQASRWWIETGFLQLWKLSHTAYLDGYVWRVMVQDVKQNFLSKIRQIQQGNLRCLGIAHDMARLP